MTAPQLQIGAVPSVFETAFSGISQTQRLLQIGAVPSVFETAFSGISQTRQLAIDVRILGYVYVPVPDTTPPVVTWGQAAGSAVYTSTGIQLTVTDVASSLSRVLIAVSYPSGQTELAYDGTAWRSVYAAGSTATPVSGGTSYAIVRSGGWPSAPTIEVYAVDAAGNLA